MSTASSQVSVLEKLSQSIITKMDAYERIACVKNEVFVYKIPPLGSNRGHKANLWSLDQPDWTGRMRVVEINDELFVKLEDKTTGELFAQCPIDEYPSVAVEKVTDSSRYFVIRIQQGNQKAFIGIGFAERGDAFDFIVALQDHFKQIKNEAEAVKEMEAGPKLDLGFKEGQTIKLNLHTKKNEDGSPATTKPRPKPSGGGLGLLPPPPGGRLPPPPSGPSPVHQARVSPSHQPAASPGKADDLLGLGFDAPAPPTTSQPSSKPSQPGQPTDVWGDFCGTNNSSSSGAAAPPASGQWVQFS